MIVRSADGTRIAYDRVGDGEPLVLLHGGFVQDRKSWWTAGYVDRLQSAFQLLVVDLRGHGESDHPTRPEAYSADKVVADVAAVLDAERVSEALIWGFSYGASVALQFARASPDRVTGLALGGAALGQWLSPEQAAKTAAGMRGLAQAKQAGALGQLPPEQRLFAVRADLSAAAAVFEAMGSWPTVEAESLVGLPAFFYAGAQNPIGAAQLRTHQEALRHVGARWTILDGLDHMGEFNSIDRALPACVEFFRAR